MKKMCSTFQTAFLIVSSSIFYNIDRFFDLVCGEIYVSSNKAHSQSRLLEFSVRCVVVGDRGSDDGMRVSCESPYLSEVA